MELLNSTKCVCGKELKNEKFEKYTPRPLDDSFYGGRVRMTAEITCECGRELKGYFETSQKKILDMPASPNSAYALIDLEVIKDITPEEKIENTPTSEVEIHAEVEDTDPNGENLLVEQKEEKLEIVEEEAPYIPVEYEKMTYKELQLLCKERGLKSVGRRDALIKQLKG